MTVSWLWFGVFFIWIPLAGLFHLLDLWDDRQIRKYNERYDRRGI